MSLSTAKPEVRPDQTYCRLEVEVDFKHEPGMASIRFYSKEGDDYRNLLSLASLTNRIIEQNCVAAPLTRVWSEADTSFLKWLNQHVSHIPYRMRNVTMLKITLDNFERWRQRWSDIRTRFIERSSQEYILPPGCDTPCRQFVDLEDAGEGAIRIVLKIEFSDGVTRCPHEILKNLGIGGDRQRQRDFANWQPPVSWAQMNKYFYRKSPSLPKDRIVDLLGELLEGHLEIVKPGPLVEVYSQLGGNAKILAEITGRGIRIHARFNGKSLPLTAADAAGKCEISEKDGKFRICSSSESEASGKMRRQFAEWGKSRGALQENGEILLRNGRDNARALREIWQSATKGEGTSAMLKPSPQLRGLLDKPADIVPQIAIRESNSCIETELSWRDKDIPIEHQTILQAVASNNDLIALENGGWLIINTDHARKTLEEIRRRGIQDYESLSPRKAAAALDKISLDGLVGIADSSSEIFQRIVKAPQPEIPPLPEGIGKILRPYQSEAYEFLADRLLCNVGCILADDMGLGKTLEVIALLAAWKQSQGKKLRCLVISPATLMGHWREQIAKFANGILTADVIDQVQSVRKAKIQAFASDILITHYGLVRNDEELFKAAGILDMVILDEAQTIKNPIAQATMAVKSLKAKWKIAMTGTPLENRLNDLWSIMDFLNPGLLGNLETFETRFAGDGIKRLTRRLAPFILRRTKEQVARELPPKTVEVLRVPMTDEQRRIYDETLAESKAGLNKSTHFEILACLTRLRQICCHPDLYLKRRTGADSGKMKILMESLEELTAGGHSVLVFSQFTSMLKLVAEELKHRAIPYSTITGETPVPERMRLVKQFNEGETHSVMLLSIKAGGTGLTLTKADYAFLCDPWWNPAVENQAIDRIHRIGQTRPVFAYRLIAENSIEERVLRLLNAKQALFDAVVGDDNAVAQRLGQQGLLALLQS